jgi:class 3 adenylate cyclase
MDPAASIARGFLFADLRGYSAWVERHGDHAAAALIREYRDLVRQAVGEHRGAEIKTEGDSFYVAFDSPSAAVRCGLRVLELAAASGAAATGLIPVGIGVHAGETVATEEGFVGSAVNIAARVCAQARAGELLVTDAVRALTGTYLDVGFQSVGRRRLKGIAEPVGLYRVTPERVMVAVPAWRRVATNRPLVAAALAIPLVMVVAVIGGALVRESAAGPRSDGSPSPSGVAAATASTSAMPSSSAELEFPTAAEFELVQLVPERYREECRRADLDDAPIADIVRGFPGQLPVVVHKAPSVAGVECDLGGIAAPDVVWYWELIPGGGADRAEIVGREPADQSLGVHGVNVGATPGVCRDQRPASEEWSFGGVRGTIVCYETEDGDAVLLWVFDDGGHLFGRAERRDQDMGALLDWWEDVGRFAVP